MSLNTNFNVNPYYDDFDETKKFLRLLFKPGFAVQARELTQLQTLLQNQIGRFGNNVFKNGSIVTGGQTFLQDATYLKLDTDYAGTAVIANNFNGLSITNLTGTKRGEVIVVYDTNLGTGDPKTLYVKQLYGDPFASGETIKTVENSSSFANISTSGVGTGQTFSINEGVFYYDGFFIKNDAQTIATSKYNNTTANARIGFEVTESIPVYTQDTSLLDPAQDASNFQAPGSDRYKINLVLATRSLDSTDLTQFIEIARVEEGQLTYVVKYPIYAEIEATLARRTYDESGNYTVRPFKLALQTSSSNTANAQVILSPGKAYVYGYEHETIAPTTIVIAKPRTTDSATLKSLSADYGYYVYSNTHYGSFPINSLQTIDLHCVPNSAINVSSTATITNTKIGTARVKSISYETAANTSNSATYEYRTYLFDVNVGSITGNVLTSNTTSITIGNVGSGQYYTTVNNAYTGATVRITAGPGAGETPKTITNFNGATGVITLSEPFVASPNTQSTWSIDFEFAEVESLAVISGTTRLAAADIAPTSKDYASTYQDTVISDSTLEPLIFNLGQNYVSQNSVSTFVYSYKKLYVDQQFNTNVSTPLNIDAGTEELASAAATNSELENYQIVVTEVGGSPYKVGQIISNDLYSIDTGTKQITVTNGASMKANITAVIKSTNPTVRTKTYIGANATVQTSGGTSIFANNGVILYATQGQTHIMANTVIKTPDTPQSLFVPDVIELVSVLDFNNTVITTANASSAIDVTSKYILDVGQKDSYYDHASIKLRPGFSAPVGPLVVKYNAFSATGVGYFSVDSYLGYYESIPTYNSQINGTTYKLRDSLDFRPVRVIPTTPTTANTFTFDVNSTTTGPKIPQNGSDILVSYQYYLPRIDKVALNKDKVFEVIQGIPSLNPVEPKDRDGSMTMYILREPAYTANTSEIQVQYIDNRRYTMKDIGSLDKRIGNLEYYTSLSLLEQSALNKQDLTILDSTNLPRFKNGIVVDSFKGHSVADVGSSEYEAAIDPVNQELRASFNISSQLLTFDSANSTNYMLTGPLLTSNATHTLFVDQNKASKWLNINPFNVTNYLGKIRLDPSSDVWVDTEKQPDVLVNLEGDKDAWELITQNAFNYEYNDWNTVWSGTVVSGASASGAWLGHGGGRVFAAYGTQYTTTTEAQTRSGVLSAVVPSTITQSLGDRVVDVSIIPYIRNRGILFTGSDFEPVKTLYAFFDNADVNKYIFRANKFTLDSGNLNYPITTIDRPSSVNVTNTATNTVVGTCLIAKTSNTEVFVVNLNPSGELYGPTMNLVGQSAGTNHKIVGYDHYSGAATSATSSTIVLSVDAGNANNTSTYAGSPIYIIAGTGAGQQATISSYTPGTRTVNIVGTWTTTPDATSRYSIGNLTTTQHGDIAGVFNIPSGIFRIGEKNFRLIDNPTNDVGSSRSNGDASYYAQGILEKTENTIISTTVPTIQRAAVTDERVVTSTTSRSVVVGYYDPLAQTFLVSSQTYPQGIFLSKIRLCFKSKDETIPVTVQIRPTVNGYPSSSVIYPYSTTTLTPDKVKTTSVPDLNDDTKYTEFPFVSPVYLQPGEHSFVVVANSLKYEVWAAEKGGKDARTGDLISDQAYGGSLFLSQNGSTWTADQNSDMMFQLYRYKFSTSPTIAQFSVNAPSSNVAMDLVQLISTDIVLPNTSIVYTFNSEKSTGGMTGYQNITPLTDYPMIDGYGRRVLNPATGNSTFVVKATMASLNTDVTPFIDITRYGIITVENIINDLPLSNSGIVLSSGGTDYSTNANAVVTITGGGGSGATAAAVVTNNVVTSIYLTNPGSGYETSPTITLTDANTTPGTGCTITYNGEDKKSGGNSNVRYMTRRVTLADGFDSGDLRVYLTAYKPSGSNIRVYYKLLSTSDIDTFENKSYQLMTELGNANFVSTNFGDYRELLFAPGTGGVANNSVSYTSGSTSFSKFKTFSIKIVMTGTNTTDVPKIRDLRAIALPSGS